MAKKAKVIPGKMYVLKSEVWAIDFQTNPDYMLVYIRDQVFKVRDGDLVLMEGSSDDN